MHFAKDRKQICLKKTHNGSLLRSKSTNPAFKSRIFRDTVVVRKCVLDNYNISVIKNVQFLPEKRLTD